ncbi:hypothetical protein [Shewanella halifaxensis]|uniref:hypothetical protein n=1 Tax=Shewanella halifaxensis TaxID=271098 RepID=UPI001F3BC3B4|nr:hypothetical protein [Shewanella halifaxensis]
MELSFSRYIYQHRDSAGRILGMSISKSIQEEHPELNSQYLEDFDMYMVLLLLKKKYKASAAYLMTNSKLFLDYHQKSTSISLNNIGHKN